MLSVAIPFAIYVGVFYALYSLLMRERDPFHLGLLAGTAAVLVLSVVLAAAGVSVAVCLVVLVLAPAVTVVGYETLGPPAHHRGARAAVTTAAAQKPTLERRLARAGPPRSGSDPG